MKNLFIYLSIILLFGCKKESRSTQTVMLIESTIAARPMTCSKSVISGPIYKMEEPYQLNLKAKSLENRNYDLEVEMLLRNGSYFISPNSKGNYKGIFTVYIAPNNHFEVNSKLKEFPLSKEEFDPHPFVNGYVNWVRESTTYNQEIKRLSEENFEVMGYIRFTIEPQCTLEKIPFIIKYVDNALKFEIFQC